MAFKSIDATTDVDPQPIADAVVDALGPDLVDAATVEASCETAIADKVADNSIPAKTTVTDVPGQVITELNTGSGTLSRNIASALQALVDAVAANTIPSDADVAAVPASTVTALNTGTSTVSRVTASVQLGIANKVSDNTIPSNADVDAIPGLTATALNTGTSTLSRVIASDVQAIADAVAADTIPSKTDVTDIPAAVAAEIDTRLGGDTAMGAVFGPEITVTGADSEVLLAASGDPSFYVDLLGVQISVTGAAATVGINLAGEGAFYSHTYPAGQTVFLTLGALGTTADGKGILKRAIQTAFEISCSAPGATVKATPVYRTNEI